MKSIVSAAVCAIGLLIALPVAAHDGPQHVHLGDGLVMYASALTLLVIAVVCCICLVRRHAQASCRKITNAAGAGSDANRASGN
ncbi:MAG: hypothetical protein R3286_07670 [Gammaproteobacteria bacterium]|nr:hypothetical protein [Gammaproteobacteria bacterium]